MLPFQLAELLHDTAELGCQLPHTGCAMAEKGMPVKDRMKVVTAIRDGAIWWGNIREILFKGENINLFQAAVYKSFSLLSGYRYIKFAQDSCVVRCKFMV